MFAPLADCAGLGVEVVGGKARTLGIALSAGYVVPAGGCLTTEALRRTLVAAGLRRWLAERIDSIAREPLTSERTLAEIRRRIRSLDIPPSVASCIRAASEPLLGLGPLAVRSSAPIEDGTGAAYPGVFHSAVGVRSIAAIEDAVRECWASAFNARALIYGGGRPVTEMAVVIQRAVAAESAGVLFTRDPLGEAGMVAEFSFVKTDEITSGRSPSRRMRPESGKGNGSGDPTELDSQLAQLGSSLRDLFQTECDVEWAWADGQLHLLQVRPITVSASDERSTEWCDQEDLARVFTIALGGCASLLARQLQKKVWYRRFCRERGIPTYRMVYVAFTADGLAAEKERFLKNFETSHVRVSWGQDSEILPVARLVDGLISQVHRNPISRGRAAAQVGEVVPATSTGYSAVLSDGRVRIEAFPAGLHGMKDGTHTPTIHEVDPEGRVLSQPGSFDLIPQWDPEGGDWIESPSPPYEFILPALLTSAIVDATRDLAREFGEVRLEWYGVDDRLFVKDLTLESRSIDDGAAGILSPGVAVGRVIRIDVEEFDRLGREFEVSVVNDEGASARLDALAPVARVRELGGDAIVVADHASIGLIALVGTASGFVFRRGSLLCHTAIALREHRIPAVVSPRGFTDLRDGDHALIGPSGVTVLGGPA